MCVIGAKRNVFWYQRDPQKGFIRLADFKDLTLAAARKLIGVKTGAVREPSEITFSEVEQKWLKTNFYQKNVQNCVEDRTELFKKIFLSYCKKPCFCKKSNPSI